MTAQVAAERDFYKEMVDSALDIIYRSDHRGFFTYVNPAASTITGYPKEELLGMHYSDFIREDYRERVRSFYLQQMQEKKERTYLEMPIVRKDGEEIWVAQRVKLIREDGKIKEAIAVSRDVTHWKQSEGELRKAKEEAEKAQESEKAFLLRMSHEIRTPMNAIIGMAHLLYDSPLNDRQRKHLDSINHASQLLLSMVTDILHLRRMDAGEVEIQQKEFSLSSLVEAAAKMIEFKGASKHLQVTTRIAPELPERVRGGQSAINQILFCLLGNAFKFTHEGEIGISASLVSRSGPDLLVEFSIFDTGIGILPEYQSVIFEDFQQGGPDIHENYGGSGLGLSVVRKLVDLMGGNVKVKSSSAEGSVFSVQLPLEEVLVERSALYGEGREVAEAGTWAGRRILLVEDNPFNQVYALELLRGWNLDCDTAENGKEAVQACETSQYDMVLMDVQMPKMNGHEATLRIRSMSNNANARTPIIALSAGAVEDEKIKAEKAGMNDFLSKPFSPDQLREKLEMWFGPLPSKATAHAAGSAYQADPRLDEHLLEELYGGDLAYMLEMFDIFNAQTPANLLQLQQLLSAQDFDQLSAFAHKVKPTFAMVGYPGPGMALETISELSRNQGLEALPMLTVLVQGLEESVNEGMEIIQSERKKIAEIIGNMD